MSHQFRNHVVGFHMTRLMYIVCLFWLCFRTGCLLGLSEAIVSMCRDGKPESRAHVSSILEKLTGALENTEIADPDYQVSSIRRLLLIEPPPGKSNNVVFEQVQHKSGCTVTEVG